MSLSLGEHGFFYSLKREITATSLLQHWNDALHTSTCWGTDAVIKHMTNIEISYEKIKTSESIYFRNIILENSK